VLGAFGAFGAYGAAGADATTSNRNKEMDHDMLRLSLATPL
jgi:hypothetical protein